MCQDFLPLYTTASFSVLRIHNLIATKRNQNKIRVYNVWIYSVPRIFATYIEEDGDISFSKRKTEIRKSHVITLINV
jgi:hypothetical protein